MIQKSQIYKQHEPILFQIPQNPNINKIPANLWKWSF